MDNAIDWSETNVELSRRHGFSEETWRRKRKAAGKPKAIWKKIKAERVSKPKRYEVVLQNADWLKTNQELAEELNVSKGYVSTIRSRFTKPKAKRRGRHMKKALFADGVMKALTESLGIYPATVRFNIKKYGAPINAEQFEKWYKEKKAFDTIRREKSKTESRLKRLERMKRWRAENKGRLREWHRKRDKERRATDRGYRLNRSLRARLHKYLKAAILKKQWRTSELIGCDNTELKNHIEAQFIPGMTWENYGDWHIDHRIPLSRFDLSKPEQQKSACHFSNLQPLWAEENMKKSNKLIYEKVA